MSLENNAFHICVLSGGTLHSVNRTIPLLESGYRVSFIAHHKFDTVDKLEQFENATVYYMENMRPDKKRFRLGVLIKFLRKLKPDGLIVHFCGYDGFHAAILSGIRPLVGIAMGSDIVFHDTIVPLHVYLEREFTKRFLVYLDLVFAKTREMVKIVTSFSPRGKVLYNPWGVRMNSAQPSNDYSMRTSLDISKDSFVVFSPRTLSDGQRIYEIIEAFEIFYSDVTDRATLVISGKGRQPDYADTIRAKIESSEARKNIVLVDQIPKAYMNNYYSESDVVVSNSIWDGLPQTAFECALVGTPMVLSDLKHYRDVFEDGVDVLYSDGTPQDISAKLKALYENKALRDALSARSRETVRRKANFDLWSGQFLNELRPLLDGERSLRVPTLKLFMARLMITVIALLRRKPFSNLRVKV